MGDIIENKLNTKLRLSVQEIEGIQFAASKVAFSNIVSEILIFGSRTKVDTAGGDIDLLVETRQKVDDVSRAAWEFKSLLWDKIGEQKIDIFFWSKNPSENSMESQSFYSHIRPNAVEIWKSECKKN